MHPTQWIKVLLLICTIYTLCICGKNISQYNDDHHRSVETKYVSSRPWSENNRNEARCLDLFKRRHSEHLLKRYWILNEKRTSPHYHHKCLKYLVESLAQGKIKKKKTKSARIVHKRGADSNETSRTSEDDLAVTTAVPIMSSVAHFPTRRFDVAIARRPYGKTEKGDFSETHSSGKTGLELWVFFAIGIAIVMVIVVPFALTLMYYKRRVAMRCQLVSPKQTCADASSLMYNTQRRGSTDKGTESSKSTVSTYLNKDSREVAECHELVPLRRASSMERSSVKNMFQDLESDICVQESPIRCFEYDIQRTPTCVKVINTSSESRPMTRNRQSDVETATSLMYFKSRQDDGNRLQGGNVDFHRSNVDMDFVYNDIDSQRHKYQNTRSWEENSGGRKSGNIISTLRCTGQEESSQFSMYRPPMERSRNESRSSSATRSYISIPPTSPSENYIKAGSDDMYVPSESSNTVTKMAWLTKNLKGDAKNEFINYQASSGTQTDSDSSVTSPNCNTVFGTPWQFGGTFTSRGGVMQAKGSDICLVVVPNAVPKGEYVDIYGAVFTDTTEIRKKLIFSTKESLITPVVEYHAVPAQSFRRQVCVQLPHALPEEFDISLIKVYTFTVDEHGKISLYNVPVSSKANDDGGIGASWEKGTDGHSIHISMSHFSGYFCTQCESTSWPSICTMVFGSHVQITQSRREIRVILYIWDHRLTIKDYLERFRKQESDVDRQLLTDMQVPLLDSTSSDSRLVMCMEVMGGDDDRQSWRHILRPDGSRPLFKSLQVRKLSEIVHCCRQTDPIRVEWALENVPNQIPSAVFQCCIDIMHVHQSTRDYETAMREDSDDLMRTFYVRDLKVMRNSAQEPESSRSFERVDLKRTLSETMDIPQTERMCQEFGINIKDIGNFRKKFLTQEEFQLGLVEECMRRYGADKFLNLLPKVLERLHYTQVMAALEDRHFLPKHMTDFTDLTNVSAKIVKENAPQACESLGGSEDCTKHKNPFRSTSPDHRNRSGSLSSRRGSRDYPRESHKPGHQEKSSERSNDVLVHTSQQNKHHAQEEHNRSLDRENRQSDKQTPYTEHRSTDDEYYISSQNVKQSVDRYAEQNTAERKPLQNQTSSSNRGDSVLESRSESSRESPSEHFSSRSTLETSMFAHADPKDFAEALSNKFLDNNQKQTYKKEVLVNTHLQGQYLSEEVEPYKDVRDGHHPFNSGSIAIPSNSGQAHSSSLSDHVPPYRKWTGSQRLYENSQSPDKEQTSKKELCGMFTVV